MDGIEDASSPGEWNEWPGRPVGDVDNDFGFSQVDLLEVQSGAGICGQSSELRIECLISCHILKIHVDVTNGVDYCREVVDFFRRYEVVVGGDGFWILNRGDVSDLATWRARQGVRECVALS